MVQQLSLFGSVPKSQFELTLSSLITLTGSKSHNYESLTLLASPITIVKYEPNSKTTQHEQYKLHIKTAFKTGLNISEYRDWVIQSHDIPSAGKRKISTQTILESHISLQEDQELEKVIGDLGYRIETQYLQKSSRFFHNNITIEVFQIYTFNEEAKDWKTLDENTYIVKAFINVEKSTDVESLTKSSQELLNLSKELTGLIELEIPDRNSMDSRIGLRK